MLASTNRGGGRMIEDANRSGGMRRTSVLAFLLLAALVTACGGGGGGGGGSAPVYVPPAPAFVPTASARDVTTANAMGVFVSDANNSVTVVAPNASDNSTPVNARKVAVETTGSAAPILLGTNSVNSCAFNPLSGKIICSGVFGSINVIPAGGRSATVFASGASSQNHYSGGACANCGVSID